MVTVRVKVTIMVMVRVTVTFRVTSHHKNHSCTCLRATFSIIPFPTLNTS